MRKLVFVGNCQGRRLQCFYDDHLAYINGDTTDFLASYEELGDHSYHALSSADIIVMQAIDSEHSVTLSKVETNAKIVWFPNITGVFLWPFSGVEHINNQKLPHFWDGPFGREFGDRWLNRKIKAGVPPADIVDEFLGLDMAKVTNLDRLYELVMDRARHRDARTGFNTAEIIERHLTDESLFLTPANLDLPLFRHLAKGVYEQLNVPASDVDRALVSLWRTPFPAIDAPIHPSIIRHFGLKFMTPESQYRNVAGERVTYREWAESYVHYRWNDPLLKGASEANRHHRYDAAAAASLELVKTGLERSTGSAQGYASLSRLLSLKGDRDGALEAMLQAEVLDPANPHHMMATAHYLAERGELDAAEQRLRAATRKWRHFAESWGRLAALCERRGNSQDAMTAIRTAVALSPRDVGLLELHAYILGRFGTAEEALQPFHTALAADPHNASLYAAAARAETNQGQYQQALTHIACAIELRPGDADLLSQRVTVLTQSGDLMAAEKALAAALLLDPKDTRLCEAQIDLLDKLGRHEEAIAILRQALALDPENALLRRQLATLLTRTQKFTEAREIYSAALKRDWNNVQLLGALANVLSQQGDVVGAVLALHRTIQLNPNDVPLRNLLASLMIEQGDLTAADALLAHTLRLAQNLPSTLGLQSLLFIRQHRWDAALEAVGAAVEIEPMNPDLLARKAHILSEMGDYALAESALNKALAVSPKAASLHAMLGTLLLRQERRSDAKAAWYEALRYEPHHSGYRAKVEELADA